MVTEAEVHQSLLAFLRLQTGPTPWQHHLTLARLVTRALRLGRSALIQTATRPATYCLSYLAACLLWPEAVVIVTPEQHQEHLLNVEIPRLLQGLGVSKAVEQGDRLPPNFDGLLLTTPQIWLSDQFTTPGKRFPPHIPTLIDPADDWAKLTRDQLTLTLTPADWDQLLTHLPAQGETLHSLYQHLTASIRRRPLNPYHSHPLNSHERELLGQLYNLLPAPPLPGPWGEFQQRWPQTGQLHWSSRAPESQGVILHTAPMEVNEALRPVWAQQPIVLIGGFLGLETDGGDRFRQQLGLGELTTVKFSPQRQNDYIQLYVPDRIPLPNTRDFQPHLLEQLVRLCRGGRLGQRQGYRQPPAWIAPLKRPAVIIVEDVPLRAQVATTLAAEFGRLVRVEQGLQEPEGILVCGWGFWREHQGDGLPPQLLAIATLPLPSMEDPLVAGRVNHYKQQHQDWFHHYLLPVAMGELQRAVMPVREVQGVVALLDNRVNHRSYGRKILNALEPLARINYIDFL